jgi:hypothetical protein
LKTVGLLSPAVGPFQVIVYVQPAVSVTVAPPLLLPATLIALYKSVAFVAPQPTG